MQWIVSAIASGTAFLASCIVALTTLLSGCVAAGPKDVRQGEALYQEARQHYAPGDARLYEARLLLDEMRRSPDQEHGALLRRLREVTATPAAALPEAELAALETQGTLAIIPAHRLADAHGQPLPPGPYIRSLIARLPARPGLVRVVGHADGQLGERVARQRAQRYAEAAVAALGAGGVQPARWQVSAAGGALPLAASATAAGRTRNARVEILALPAADP